MEYNEIYKMVCSDLPPKCINNGRGKVTIALTSIAKFIYDNQQNMTSKNLCDGRVFLDCKLWKKSEHGCTRCKKFDYTTNKI
jgi:hypothetical protein